LGHDALKLGIVEPEETSSASQGLDKQFFRGNGYASNNRGIVENDVFYSVRAKLAEMKADREDRIWSLWISGIVIITVLKSVTTKRLLKIENTLCVLQLQ
jgi:hypothetical protein